MNRAFIALLVRLWNNTPLNFSEGKQNGYVTYKFWRY